MNNNFEKKRKIFVGGNWKCNGINYKKMIENLNNNKILNGDIDIVLALPSLYLIKAKEILSNRICLSSQDVGLNGIGAYTGEICAEMLVSENINWCILGHSERRSIFGETNNNVALKVKRAIDNNMKVILCVGESLKDRESGNTMNKCISQLQDCLNYLNETDWNKIVIAYEPVWAIGTGKVATVDQAEIVHLKLREWISQNISRRVANNIRIIYGGSVKISNCFNLIKSSNIDGFLIGGASLTSEFTNIINNIINNIIFD
tara:strand:- start:483 stop:1265 length:783 start_codon:yes stop_codon:yes gene_type:complete